MVEVSSVDSPDSKTAVPLPKALGLGRARGKFAPISVNLYNKFTSVSAAGGGINLYIAAQPSNSGEWSSFAALYDEVKVTGVAIDFNIAVGSGSGTPLAYGCMSYDPVDSTSYGSVAAAMASSQNMVFAVNEGTTSVVTPFPETKSGLWHFAAKVPKRGAARSSIIGTSAFSGEWGSTRDTADTWGFFRPYIEAAGGSVLTTLSGFVTLRCHFRNRA